MNQVSKVELKRRIAHCLSQEPAVRKVVVFGSFLSGESPGDMDIAVLSESPESYLPLAMRYRRLTRDVSRLIPLDIVPLRMNASGSIMDEVNRGEVIYER